MSTLRVDSLRGQTADGTNRYVVQVVEFTEATDYSTASGSYTQGPQTSTFTLKYPTSKVLVTANFLGLAVTTGSYNGGRFAIYRGSIASGTKITSGSEPQLLSYSQEIWAWQTLQKLDTPTGDTTYSIGFNKHSNASFCKIMGAYGNTVITMMEIAQ
tara:strand:- start:1481 stop:1951 length:471 start_codon:yes stop_codon:yes gene_type:complete